jgi:hypothetical protein
MKHVYREFAVVLARLWEVRMVEPVVVVKVFLLQLLLCHFSQLLAPRLQDRLVSVHHCLFVYLHCL